MVLISWYLRFQGEAGVSQQRNRSKRRHLLAKVQVLRSDPSGHSSIAILKTYLTLFRRWLRPTSMSPWHALNHFRNPAWDFHSLRIYPYSMVWTLPRPWSETMVSIPLWAQKTLEIKGFLGLERPFLDLVSQTPCPRGRGRPLFAGECWAWPSPSLSRSEARLPNRGAQGGSPTFNGFRARKSPQKKLQHNVSGAHWPNVRLTLKGETMLWSQGF